MSAVRPSLDALLTAPACADELSRQDLNELLLQASSVTTLLAARLAAMPANGTGAAKDITDDKMLTVQEVSQRLRKSRRWVYRHTATWSFVRRLSERSLLISEAGLNRWLANPMRGPRRRK